MRVYHFLSSEYALQAIQFKRMKVALLTELNDPFEHYAVNLKLEETRRAFKYVKQQMAKGSGFLCFSKDRTNPVQWSHYADRHRGICLGFDIPNHDLILPITYKSKRIEFDSYFLSGENLIPPNLLLSILTTKYSHWKYEKEVRLVTKLHKDMKVGNHYFSSFDKDLILKEVIVGSESKTTRRTVEKLLSKYPYQVRLSKARLAFQSFKVVRQRNSAIW